MGEQPATSNPVGPILVDTTNVDRLQAELAAARDREKGLRRLCDSSVTGMLAVSAIRALLAPETHEEGKPA